VFGEGQDVEIETPNITGHAEHVGWRSSASPSRTIDRGDRIYRQILAIDSRHADSLHLLGMIAYQRGSLEVAAELIRGAISNHPNGASYHANLGNVLQAQGNLAQAVVEYKRALSIKPNLAAVHINLGNVLQAQGELDGAVASYQRGLELEPNNAEAHYNLGNAWQAQDRPDDAIASYERALANRPDHAAAHHNLGRSLSSVGNLDEASARYQHALSLQPENAQIALSLALAQLLQGNFIPGWPNYERRWQSADHDTPLRTYCQPFWKGERLSAGLLLLWGEQGIGDEIMFAGLIPEAVLTAGKCVLDCDPRLKPLFARSFPEVEVVAGYDPERFAELDVVAHLPNGSLPGLFRRSSAAFAATTSPYLLADSVQRNQFRSRYADDRRLVGLAWHTNSRKTGHLRSIDPSLLAPLFARPEIRWVSLQYGDHDTLENQAARAGASVLIDCSVDQLSDMDAFAAQVAAMDLVITIDNSTAHLAGALGVAVWVLLPFVPDWRWLMNGERSSWYPSMRLFRQPKRGDWHSVVQSVNNALDRIEAHRGSHRPTKYSEIRS
jgi:tetratricopeptide (TPR) repeat protein